MTSVLAQNLFGKGVPIIALQTRLHMSAKLVTDRHFLVLRGITLAVFAERILRATQHHPAITCPEPQWQNLEEATLALREVLANSILRSRDRVANQRIGESRVRLALVAMADVMEKAATCKYDLFTAGFGVRSEKSDPSAQPSRRMRRHQAAIVRVGLVA